MAARLPLTAARSAAMRSPAAGIGARSALRPQMPLLRSQPQRGYATFEGEPHPDWKPKKRSFLPRFLLWTTTGLTLFYGVSTVVALNNQAYQDWFSENMPFAEDLLDYLDTHDVVSEAKHLDYGGIGSQAIDAVGGVYNRVSDAAGRVISGAEEEAHGAGDRAKKAQQEARNKLIEAKEAARKQVARVSTKTEEKLEEAKEEGKDAVKDLRAGADKLIQRGKDQADKAEKEVKKVTKDVKKEVPAAPAADTASRPSSSQPMPATTDAQRPLKAQADPATRLRPDAKAVKLPQLAPSLSSLTGSEPMIGQLASTIDDLAAFVRDAPSPSAGSDSRAAHVLDEAKAELQRLSARLDDIRKTEQSRAEKSLSVQAKKYEEELKRKASEQAKKFEKLDEEGKKQMADERERASKDYEAKLRTELETQREIINERLKEEVVAQGVEMQRRWMKEIKRRVEEERGGRLARLDDLAGQLGEIEKVTVNNSAALEEGSGAHRTAAAVRALVKAALADVDADADPNAVDLRRSYRKELDLLRSTPLAQQSDLVRAAIEVLEPNGNTGVESLASLTSWYVQRVKPRLQQVALLPDQAGLLSHMASALLSPLLFTKSGNPQGDDAPSVLARAEYALLQRRDLDTAAREINNLKGWAKVLAQDWLEESRRRLEVEQGVKIVQAEAAWQSLRNA